jgi:hypothetical protein
MVEGSHPEQRDAATTRWPVTLQRAMPIDTWDSGIV